MKKIYAILLALTLTVSLTACGGEETTTETTTTEATTAETTTTQATTTQATDEPTPEQVALAEEYLAVAEEFDVVGDRVNANIDYLADTGIVEVMNDVADEIIAVATYFEDLETLTPEVMADLEELFALTYDFIDETTLVLDELEWELTETTFTLDYDTIASWVYGGYLGFTDDGAPALLAVSEDMTTAIAIFADDITLEAVSFVGNLIDNSDGSVTIEDPVSELAFTFGFEDMGDGTFLMDMGDIGTAVLAPAADEDLLLALQGAIENYTHVA